MDHISRQRKMEARQAPERTFSASRDVAAEELRVDVGQASTYRLLGEAMDGRVVCPGSRAVPAAPSLVAAPVERLLGHPVVMPRSPLRTYLAGSDRELVSRRPGGPRLSLVTRVATAPYWKRRTACRRQGAGTLGVCSLLTDRSGLAGG